MTTFFLISGLASGLTLAILLVLTVSAGGVRVWPAPDNGSWQSLAFWSLFRVLNLSGLALVALDWGSLGYLPDLVRVIALTIAAVCAALYLRSLVSLGPGNTYCRRAGLVDRGVYRWTRNPQYATVIPAYLALTVGADSALALPVIALLVLVYVLMAYAEEPWLKAAYPGAYDRYARRVPRFYNWRRTRAFLRIERRQLAPIPIRIIAPALRHLAATSLPRKRQ
jgi:protein-S-isoprenylcysteine O-methyltransferase Ste14